MIYSGLTADSALIRQFLDWGLDINAASRGYALLTSPHGFHSPASLVTSSGWGPMSMRPMASGRHL